MNSARDRASSLARRATKTPNTPTKTAQQPTISTSTRAVAPRPGQGDDRGGQVGQPEQQVPDDVPAGGAVEGKDGLHADGDERAHGEQDHQREDG